MEHYLLVKDIHITTAILSLFGFCLRAWWMFTNNKLLHSKIVKITPHINDTILLGSAVYLSVVSELYPFVVGWLGVKLMLLLIYVFAGTIALKRGKTKKTRVVALVVAISSIIVIFYLAIFKPVF